MSFLRRVISVPGILSGTDLVTGEQYHSIVPSNIDSFLSAHLFGPGRSVESPEVDVMTGDGEYHRVRAHVRATVMPFGADGCTTHVAVRFKTVNSLRPSEAIIAASQALHRACIDHYMERSVLTGVWVLWVVFPAPVQVAHASSVARRVREVLRGVGVIEGDYVIPLHEVRPTPLHLPCMFFSGGFFGRLFRVDDAGNMRELGGDSAASVDPVAPAPTDGHRELDELLEQWFTRYGDRAARAGDVVGFAKEVGLLPSRLAGLAPQATAIGLGRMLLDASKAGSARFLVTASRSGNSNQFRIERRAEDSV